MIIWLMDNSISLMELLAGIRRGEWMLESSCCVIVKENHNTLLHMYKSFSSDEFKVFWKDSIRTYLKLKTKKNETIKVLFSILWVGKVMWCDFTRVSHVSLRLPFPTLLLCLTIWKQHNYFVLWMIFKYSPIPNIFQC